MKQVLEMFAQYNKGVNEKVISILAGVPEDQLKRDTGTFYKSILHTFVHMTMADINWLKRLENIFPYPSLSKGPFGQTSVDELQAKIERHYQEVFAIRRAADVVFGELIKELKEEDLEKIVNYKNKKGEDLSKKLGHIILHLFNHKTHHRGEISAMLDIQKVSNDFSGMVNYL